jgi:hypothetical protein
MFARRATTEISSSQEDRGIFVASKIQFEGRIRRPIFQKSPVKEKVLTESTSLDSLQELLWNDLIGIYIGAVHRRNNAGMFQKWFHGFAVAIRGGEF